MRRAHGFPNGVPTRLEVDACRIDGARARERGPCANGVSACPRVDAEVSPVAPGRGVELCRRSHLVSRALHVDLVEVRHRERGVRISRSWCNRHAALRELYCTWTVRANQEPGIPIKHGPVAAIAAERIEIRPIGRTILMRGSVRPSEHAVRQTIVVAMADGETELPEGLLSLILGRQHDTQRRVRRRIIRRERNGAASWRFGVGCLPEAHQYIRQAMLRAKARWVPACDNPVVIQLAEQGVARLWQRVRPEAMERQCHGEQARNRDHRPRRPADHSTSPIMARLAFFPQVCHRQT